MADPTLSYGDLPAWFALGISLVTIYQQSKQNKRISLDVSKQNESSIQQEKTSKENLINLKRQLRAEQMYKDIDELLALAVDYWTQPSDVGSTSALMIKSKSQDLAHRCNKYRVFLWQSAASDFSKIRRTITGGLFEVRGRDALSTNSPVIKEASRAIDDFKMNLRNIIDRIDDL